MKGNPPEWIAYALITAMTLLYAAVCRYAGRVIGRAVSRRVPDRLSAVRRPLIAAAALVFGVGMAFIMLLLAILLWYAIAAIA